MNIRDLEFVNKTRFTSIGFLNFYACKVTGRQVVLHFYRSGLEPESGLSFETNSTAPFVLERILNFDNLNMNTDSRNTLSIYLNDVTREVRITHSLVRKFHLRVYMGGEFSGKNCRSGVNVNKILIENSHIEDSSLYIYPVSSMTIGGLTLRNVEVKGSYFLVVRSTGYVSMLFENCSFTATSSSLLVSIANYHATYVALSNCRFNINNTYCIDNGCVIHMAGAHLSVLADEMRDILNRLNCPGLACECDGETLIVANTIIEGTIDSGNVISVDHMCCLLLNSSIHVNIMWQGGSFLFFPTWAYLGQAHNLIINATIIHFAITLISVAASTFDVQNVSIFCPQSFNVNETSTTTRRLYSCASACSSDMYTFQAGKALLQGEIGFFGRTLLATQNELTCFHCPVGASCGSHIRSLPNYWGFQTEKDSVTMIRCPEGYCCTGNDTCQGISSCNTNRIGTLCGRCFNNMTESLLSTTCMHIDQCSGNLVIILYIICAVLYTAVLLTGKGIKDKILIIFKNVFNVFKQKATAKHQVASAADEHKLEEIIPRKRNTSHVTDAAQRCQTSVATGGTRRRKNKWHNRKCPSKGAETQTDIVEEQNNTKYLQILFYYIQDSNLFKVKLPHNEGEDESLLVTILQFSPQVISLCTNILDICFVSATPAVAKVLFKSLLGPTVMICLFLVYLVQKVISRFLWSHSQFWCTTRCALTEAFVFTVLFAYQRIVSGAFALVQCVEVGKQEVLYIQGDIMCYTWWQYITKIYICTSVIPIFLVLSHTPFYVQDKIMSVRTFVLACIFPLPVILCFLVSKFLMARPMKTRVSQHVQSEETAATLASFDTCSSLETSGDHAEPVSTCAEPIGTNMSSGIEIEITIDTVDAQTEPHDLITENPERVIVKSLLEHYKCLRIGKIRFTWLGIYKLYRVGLVACNTYITDPFERVCSMSAILTLMTLASSLLQPYKDRRANLTAQLSYAANLCIAVINLWKTALVTFGCQTNCHTKTLLWSIWMCLRNCCWSFSQFQW